MTGTHWIAAADYQKAARAEGRSTACLDYARIEQPAPGLLIAAMAEAPFDEDSGALSARQAVQGAMDLMRERAADGVASILTEELPQALTDTGMAPPAGFLAFTATKDGIAAWHGGGAALIIRTAPAPGLGYRDLTADTDGFLSVAGPIRFLAALSSALRPGYLPQLGLAQAAGKLDRFVSGHRDGRSLHESIRAFLRQGADDGRFSTDASLILGGVAGQHHAA